MQYILCAISAIFLLSGVWPVHAANSENASPHKSYSGIYPHLAFFNNEQECGTGAVVPWAGSLWAVTYAPHKPEGSSDKLYEITPDLKQIVRPESIGGTPANRMIHRESQQLFIGPYVIDAQRNVRVIPYSEMYGRPTGNARHLTDPVNKIYSASMEEALYEIDVNSLEVKTIYHDEQVTGQPKSDLPGYHGKGLYSGQGRLIYANNGEHGPEARINPFVASGVLTEWNGSEWTHILRNQFTDVTGPGGIYGNQHPETDPVWSIGWDAKSLILMMLDHGTWYRFRLPKASHSYDGAHGWNTEWPRIRDIGEDDLLMTMHGMFWRFPKQFSAGKTAGIRPRSSYLKVVGDFCRWQDRIVLGCDDTAQNEFLNTRKAKGHIAAPQSQSNLWFLKPEQLDQLGPVIGRGGVWLNDNIKANQPSDPFLFSGYTRRMLHLAQDGGRSSAIRIEIDREGTNKWEHLTELKLSANGYLWHEFDQNESGAWLRLISDSDISSATAWFEFSGDDIRSNESDGIFEGLATIGDTDITGGVMRASSDKKRTLQFAASRQNDASSEAVGYYELDVDMKLVHRESNSSWKQLQKDAAIPAREGILEIDKASVIYIDDSGKRFRLPKSDSNYDNPGPLGWGRLDREVATERDLFNCHGTFYELPAENAGGFSRVRPVASHKLQIFDYCSYRGLMVISGVSRNTAADNSHIIQSDDGRTALWVGAIDDIWKLGKAVGLGGPWKKSAVKAGAVSDPYLIRGYDRKTLDMLSTKATTVRAEIDLTGMGDWKVYKTFKLASNVSKTYEFPDAFQAYWIRFTSSAETTLTAQLIYE